MDWLQPIRIFVSVVQNGSLSSAGRQLGLSPASVSRHISALESSLGCRLLNRSSRKLTLTEAGEQYFTKVEQILHQVAEANDAVAQLQTTPRGTLRVHTRMLVGHLVVIPALPAKARRSTCNKGRSRNDLRVHIKRHGMRSLQAASRIPVVWRRVVGDQLSALISRGAPALR